MTVDELIAALLQMPKDQVCLIEAMSQGGRLFLAAIKGVRLEDNNVLISEVEE